MVGYESQWDFMVSELLKCSPQENGGINLKLMERTAEYLRNQFETANLHGGCSETLKYMVESAVWEWWQSERAESRPFPGKKPPTTRSRTETTPERSPSESVKRTKVEADITKSTELAAPRYTKGSSEPSWSGMGYPAAARPDVTRQVTPSFGGSRIETEYTRIPIPRKDEILKEFNGLKNKLLIGSESPSNPTWCDRLSITQTHGWSDRFVVIPPRSGRRRISVPFLTVLVEHPNSWLCMTGEGMSYIQNLKHDIRQKNKNLKVTIQRPKGYHTAPFSAFIVDYLGVDYRSDPDVADIYFLMEFADQFRANCVKYYLRTTPEDIYTGWRKFLSANPGTFPYNRSFKFPDTPAPAPPAALNNAPPLKRSFSEFLAEDATPAGNRASRNTPERRPPPFLQLPLRIRAAAPRAEQPPNPRLEQPAALRVEQFETYTLEAARKILFAELKAKYGGTMELDDLLLVLKGKFGIYPKDK